MCRLGNCSTVRAFHVLYHGRYAAPASGRVAWLRLPEQLSVHHPCLPCGLKPELFIECVSEVRVSLCDRLAQSERVFGLQCETPARLVQPVEGDSLLGHLQRAVRVAASEPYAADALKQVEQGGA